MFVEFVQEQWLLFLALAIILFMLIQSYFGSQLAGYANVSPEQATRLINDGAFVLDVRSVDEYRAGHISGAKNLSITDLEEKLSTLEAHKAGPTLIYCDSGSRSARACALLRKAGFEQLSNLAGGLNAWRAAQLPLVKPGKKKK